MTSSRVSLWQWLATAWLASVAGCTSPARSNDAPTLWRDDDPGGVERVVSVSAWDTTALYGEAPDDTLLRSANRIAATSKGLYVLDEFAGRLVYFDSHLRVRWQRDVRGGTDYRPAAIRDLKVTRDGMAALLNNDRHTLVLIDTAGALRTTIDLRQAGSAEQLAPIGQGDFVLYSMANTTRPFVLIDGSGKVLGRFAFPWAGFAKLSGLATQGRLAEADDVGGHWAFLFVYGDGWFVFNDTVPSPYPGRNVEHTDFPSIYVDGRSIHVAPSRGSAQTAMLGDSTLSVLFAGASEGRLRYIDRYSISDGTYLGSYLLPTTASAVGESSGLLYVLTTGSPSPIVLALRPKKAAPARGAKTARSR